MENNPFRRKPSTNVQQSAEDWGKTKFKPNKFSGGGNKKFFNKHQGGVHKPFNKKFGNRKGTKSNDNYKFNQVAQGAKPENATPWNKYKDEIVFKNREEEQAALQANMDSSEAKNTLKQREINYRKSLIEQKKQEITKWEDFGENEENNNTTKKNSKNQIKGPKGKHLDKNKIKIEPNKPTKTDFKKNLSNLKLKSNVKQLISKDILDNFDSKKLDYQQNDVMRSVITKTTILAFGETLESVVKDMKLKKSKKNKFSK